MQIILHDSTDPRGVEPPAALADDTPAAQAVGDLMKAQAVLPHLPYFGNDQSLLINGDEPTVLVLIAER